MPLIPRDLTPSITYAHSSAPAGPRFRQYAKDRIPPWAVDVQPYIFPLQQFYNHLGTSTPEQWQQGASSPAEHLYLHAGSRLRISHQQHENPAFAPSLNNPEAEETAFLDSFDNTIGHFLSPTQVRLLIEHLTDTY